VGTKRTVTLHSPESKSAAFVNPREMPCYIAEVEQSI
jgi:hypothetical protein